MKALKAITAASIFGLIAVPYSALAQTQDAPQDTGQTPQNSAQPSEIIVTGSRIARSTFNSSTPVTVMTGEQIEALGQVNIAETIQTLPQNVATVSDTNVGLTANTAQYNIGASIANLRGLNPQNGVRTLTLVNTRRFVPSTTGGGVDLNLIPSMLVKSVETVTGGASAAYGTDALAGVVNIILDTDLQGFKGQVDYGQTFRGDGTSLHLSAAAGTDFAGGAGHVVFGVEYQDNGEVGDCVYVREWCAVSPDAFTNEAYKTNGQPHYIRDNHGAYTNYNTTGVFRGSTAFRFNPAALRNVTFSPDGKTAVDFQPGDYTQAIGFYERQGGDCLLDCSPWSEVQLRPEVKRLSTYFNAKYEFSPSLKANLEASYGFRKSNIKGLSLGPSSGHPIREDNFFLQGVTYYARASGQNVLLTDLIAANQTGGSTSSNPNGVSQAPGVPILPLFIAKHFRNVDGARSTVSPDLETFRVMAGLEGELGFLNGWKWDAYYQYGKTSQNVTVSGLRVNNFFVYAIDAVDEGMATTGVANGKAVCRATLPGAPNTSTPPGFFQFWNQPGAAGCVPLNLIGESYNPAAVAYAYRTATEQFRYQQHVAALNFSGELFEGWAGPIALALGAEYRFEKGSAVHTDLPFDAEFSVDPFGNDYGGDLKILEGYVEANIPLLRDLPMADYVELNAAFRHTRQSNSDAITGNSKDLNFNTWKISGTWDVTDWLRFRATRSRDVRAASFVDLYYNLGKTLSGPPAGRANNPWLVAGQSLEDFADILYPPNFALNPEIGNTLTAGIVLQPRGALNGLRLSVDYYNIKIRDAIVGLSAQQTVDACFRAEVACDHIFTGLDGKGTKFSDIAPAQRGLFDSILRGNANIGLFTQSGWDVELAYSLPLQRLSNSLPGRLTLRGLATITEKMQVDLGNGSGAIEYVNQTGGSAFGGFAAPTKYTLTGYATYDVGGFSITGDVTYIPKGIYDIAKSDTVANTDPTSINYNYVDSRTYFGLSVSHEIKLADTSTAEVFVSVRNLFDVAPPSAPNNVNGTGGYVAGNGGPTNPIFYDTLGARWRAGVRVKF